MSTTDDWTDCPEWPPGIDLPAGQAAMTHADWIDYLEPIIVMFEESPPNDYRIDDLQAIQDWHALQAD